MKKVGKKMLIGALCLVGILLVLFVVWVFISSGTIRTYEGEKSLSEKFVKEINGAPNGFFINSKNTDNPVILFVSSGPGTDDYVFTDKYEDMNLEDDFTVVYWDYRSMGIAYDSDYDPEQITLENLLKDTYTVTQYLKERFDKSRIFIMGFSGGTHLALRAAYQHPEDYYALINMAQCITDSYERDTLMYEFMKDIFTSRNDKSSLNKLENIVEHIEGSNVKCYDWYEFVNLLHDAGGGTILNKTEFTGIVLPIIFSKCYTVSEKINYIRGMKMYRKTPLSEELKGFDYRKEIPELQIPVYFISGESDYNCPWPLVKEYCDMINAPDKGFYLIPDSAHSPLWENAGVTCEVMRQIKEKCIHE